MPYPHNFYKQSVFHKKVAETEVLQLSLWHIKLFGFLVVGFEWIKKFLRIAKCFNFRTKGVFCGDVRHFLYLLSVLEI